MEKKILSFRKITLGEHLTALIMAFITVGIAMDEL